MKTMTTRRNRKTTMTMKTTPEKPENWKEWPDAEREALANEIFHGVSEPDMRRYILAQELIDKVTQMLGLTIGGTVRLLTYMARAGQAVLALNPQAADKGGADCTCPGCQKRKADDAAATHN